MFFKFTVVVLVQLCQTIFMDGKQKKISAENLMQSTLGH